MVKKRGSNAAVAAKLANQVGSGAEALQQTSGRIAKEANKKLSSSKTRKQMQSVLVQASVVSVLLSGILNTLAGLGENPAMALVGAHTLVLGVLMGVVEFDRSRRAKKKNGAVSNGMTRGLIGERMARNLVTKSSDYTKVLALAAVEPLTFGWGGLLTAGLVSARTFMLLSRD